MAHNCSEHWEWLSLYQLRPHFCVLQSFKFVLCRAKNLNFIQVKYLLYKIKRLLDFAVQGKKLYRIKYLIKLSRWSVAGNHTQAKALAWMFVNLHMYLVKSIQTSLLLLALRITGRFRIHQGAGTVPKTPAAGHRQGRGQFDRGHHPPFPSADLQDDFEWHLSENS